ncbi:MAG: hypothetical protein A3I66_13600 [Burkholderiales bacterium RIFCSPLOWO2_02_FULL_57_36]|nr:MAG: hypothetical protein A3I66_13600 [Burkholderiales bacterium RIFCSPLOWO2_02_FULL_57_36]
MTASVRVALAVASLLVPPQAVAHSVVSSRDWWTLDPWVWMPLWLFCALYLKGISSLRKRRNTSSVVQPGALTAFSAGMIGLFLALIWPLDALGAASFAAHMAQHMLLIAFAAPLLVLARSSVPITVALAGIWPHTFSLFARTRKFFNIAMRPRIAFSIHAAVIWLWHAPLLFEAALRWPGLHIVEHISFLGAACCSGPPWQESAVPPPTATASQRYGYSPH